MTMFFNYIDQQLLRGVLKDFKDSYIINDKGNIFNYAVGAMIYDWIEEMNKDTSYEPKEISFHLTEDEKKSLWKEANKGLLITVWDKEREDLLKEATPEYLELHKQIRKQIIIKIYKTKLVEYLFNKLADNGQFIEINLDKIVDIFTAKINLK